MELVEKTPLNMVHIIENDKIGEDELLKMLNGAVIDNDKIFGSCIAFEPNMFKDNAEKYAPYYYKTPEGTKYKDLGQNHYEYFKWDWYTIPHNTNSTTWTEPYLDKGGGNIIMATYSVPFYSGTRDNQAFKGVITADISLTWLKNLVNSVKIYKTGYAFIVSKEGRFIIHPNDQIMMKETISSLAKKYHNPTLIKADREMKQGKSNFLPYKSVLNGKRYRLFYKSLGKSNWSMGVVFLEEELFAGLNKLLWRMLLIGIVGTIGLFIVIILVSKSVIRPLQKLSVTASEIGAGNFDIEIVDNSGTREIILLENSLKRMQEELKKYIKNLKRMTAANEKIESELCIAHDIQMGMIPKTFPPFPNRTDVDIFATLKPARQVGGDFYDFFFIEKDLLCFSVGDVSDKGIPASLMMATTITLLRAEAKKITRPSDIVRSINQELSKKNDSAMFVTMFLGILNLKTKELNFCNAGHNYPYISKISGEILAFEETHGPPLGVYYNQEYQSNSIYLEHEDSLFIYTDGILEAMNKPGELYGYDRLKSTIAKKCINKPPVECVNQIIEDLAMFTNGAKQSDDITLMAIQVNLSKKQSVVVNTKQLILKNKISEIRKIKPLLESVSEEWHLSDTDIFELNLVVEEWVSNIIFYAFKDEKEHEIRISFSYNTNSISILIIDDGLEFNLTKVPTVGLDKPIEERVPGGLGIHFIKFLVDHIEYTRKDKKNELLLTKKLKRV